MIQVQRARFTAGLILGLGLALGATAAGEAGGPAAGGGTPVRGAPVRRAPVSMAPVRERIFATEDSLRVYVVPETTRVVAKRVPLAEIIRKAQEGERHKYDGISTLAFNRTLKVTMEYGGRKPKKQCVESVARVYYQSPDRWTETSLRESKYVLDADGERRPWDEKEDDGGVKVEVHEGKNDAHRLTDVPAYLEETEKYDFQIAHRSLQRDQVLYEITFEPKSDFDVLPGGRIWLLTNGYQIVREEYHLKNLPVPWLLKSLGLLTREWQQVEGRWVPSRITARAELRSGLGLGLIEIPSIVEAVLLFDQYRLDLPLDATLFDRRQE